MGIGDWGLGKERNESSFDETIKESPSFDDNNLLNIFLSYYGN